MRIKIATLAPEGSTWVKTLNAINAELQQKTEGQVRLRIYPGGVLGDEKDMLRKMQIQQIHGAGLSSPGLSMLYKELDIFQVPFLFQNHGEVDYVLTQMDAFFRKGLDQSGYVLLGWTGGGFVRLMTITPATTLEDLQQAKVWTWEDAPISRAIFEAAGVTGIPLSVPDVMVGLQTGLVDVVYAPPAGAIALQWFTRVKYITDLPLIYVTGGVVIKKNIFQSLETDHQAIVKQVFSEHLGKLISAIRQDNEEALQIMIKHGVQMVTPPPDQIEAFKQISARALKNLPVSTFVPATMAEANRLLEEYRAGKP
jgi:TRAP-type C4-dicarboxylate transport system substrate-binding protein